LKALCEAGRGFGLPDRLIQGPMAPNRGGPDGREWHPTANATLEYPNRHKDSR